MDDKPIDTGEFLRRRRAAMEDFNKWEAAHPRNLTPAEALSIAFQLNSFLPCVEPKTDLNESGKRALRKTLEALNRRKS